MRAGGKSFFWKERGAYFIDYVDETGKRRREKACVPASESKRAHDQAKRAADRVLQHRLDEVAEKREAAEDPLRVHGARPIDQHLDDYEAHLDARNASPRYVTKVRSRIRRCLDHAQIGTLADIDAVKVDAFLRELKDEVRERTRRHYRAALVGFGRWLAKRRRIDRNPFEDIAEIAGTADPKRKRRGWLTDEKVVRLLAAARARGVENYARTHPNAPAEILARLEDRGEERALLYAVAIGTGLRMNELRMLTWADVRIEGARLSVRVRAEHAKNRNAERVTIVAPWLIGALTARQRARAERDGRVPAGKNRALRVPRSGDQVLEEFYKDLRFAAIDREDESGRQLDFHCLRRTCAARLILAGANPKYVQRVMRHRDIRLTFDLYGDLELDELLDADPIELPAPGVSPNPSPSEGAKRAHGG